MQVLIQNLLAATARFYMLLLLGFTEVIEMIRVGINLGFV